MRIVFRVDGYVKTGSGHVARCLTLAEALKKRGANVKFISRKNTGDLNQYIQEQGFRVAELPNPGQSEFKTNTKDNNGVDYRQWLGVSERQDAIETICAINEQKPDWLIVDHYALDEKWEKSLRPYVGNIMVIDDLANRKHDCDLLLDQNWFENMEMRYDGLVPGQCTRLLGPNYALLRPEFAQTRKKSNVRNGKVERIFVFFGGSDIYNLTSMTLTALSEPELSHLKVDVVIGENNLHRTAIQKLTQLRNNTYLHVQVADMASVMAGADLAIGAGGAATWERMCLKLESHVIISADNQKEVNEQLAKNQFISLIGFADSMSSRKISIHVKKRVLGSAPKYNDYMSLCDGAGTERVMGKLLVSTTKIQL